MSPIRRFPLLVGLACLGTCLVPEAAAMVASPRIANDGVVRVTWFASVHEAKGEFVLLRSLRDQTEVVGRLPAGEGGTYVLEDRSEANGERRYVLIYVDAHGRTHELGQRQVTVERLEPAGGSGVTSTPIFEFLLSATTQASAPQSRGEVWRDTPSRELDTSHPPQEPPPWGGA